MSTEQTNDSQTGISHEPDGNRHITIRMLARHDCMGSTDTKTMEVDESFRYEELDVLVDLGALAVINRETFEQALRNAIIQCCKDHDFADLINSKLQFIDYIYDDSGEKSLQGISDEELRCVLGGDDGFIRVEWYFS